MHLIFMSQGIKPCVDAMMNDLQAQFFPWPMKDKDGKKLPDALVQGALRPIQLWQYVFPEECLDEVCNTIGIDSTGGYLNGRFGAKATILRKAMRADKIPEIDKSVNGRIIRRQGVGILPIGIRKDKFMDVEGKGIIHEAL